MEIKRTFRIYGTVHSFSIPQLVMQYVGYKKDDDFILELVEENGVRSLRIVEKKHNKINKKQ